MQGEGSSRQKPVRVLGLVEAATWVALAAAVAGFFGAHSGWLELAAHFRWQYFAWGAVALAAALAARGSRLAALAALLCVVNAIPLGLARGAPWPAAGADDARLRVVFANVHARNTSLAAFLAWLDAQRPDVVIVAELSPEHAAALAPLEEALPHVVKEPRGVFGIGVWSRHRPTRSVVYELNGDELCPVADVELDALGAPLRIVGAHLFPPLGEYGDRRNADQLRALAEYLGPDTGARVVVAGDFNVTPFAARYRALLGATALRSAADGRLPWPTWRPRGVALPFAIPIDHVFARGKGLTVADHAIGPDLGSDHRPIRVDFAAVKPD